jgi:hypothetical protein
VAAADIHGFDDIRKVARNDDSDGHLAVIGRVGGVESARLRFKVNRAGKGAAQLVSQRARTLVGVEEIVRRDSTSWRI